MKGTIKRTNKMPFEKVSHLAYWWKICYDVKNLIRGVAGYGKKCIE